jgi:dienelactone hydrolase
MRISTAHRAPLLSTLAAMLMSIVAADASGCDLRDAWPSPAEVADVAAEEVRFPSSSPFTPAEIGRAEPTTAVGQLYTPRAGQDGATPATRSIPAVILLHGASGILSAREHTYGRQLAGMGVAALVVDVFGARRDRAAGFVERLLEITETMAIADAYAALQYLAARPEIDPERIVLIGFSYGGMASIYAISLPLAERLAPGGERFAGHVAFYAPCIARFEDLRTTGAPLLMLYGDRDALINAERCAEIASDLNEGGSLVDVVVYAGAVHQWDGGRTRGPIGRLLGACRMRVAADGSVWDERTWLPMSGPVMRRLILAACVEDRPYLIGADEDVRQRSNRDLGRFLSRIFGGG